DSDFAQGQLERIFRARARIQLFGAGDTDQYFIFEFKEGPCHIDKKRWVHEGTKRHILDIRLFDRNLRFSTPYVGYLQKEGAESLEHVADLSEALKGHEGFIRFISLGESTYPVVPHYGMNLAYCLAKQLIDRSEIIPLCLKVVSTMHRLGVIHRDIRLENWYYDGEKLVLGGLDRALHLTEGDVVEPEEESYPSDVLSLGMLFSRLFEEPTDLIHQMLQEKPEERITAPNALQFCCPNS
ncbi:MAG: protein kinase family protein, partial [Verrucomicrobia bacterium]|nr:protein kinase family protein [Verrucomicrobiota bacterium]